MKWGDPLYETAKTEASCHSRCGMTKNSTCSSTKYKHQKQWWRLDEGKKRKKKLWERNEYGYYQPSN
jgi:hypothetical protein